MPAPSAIITMLVNLPMSLLCMSWLAASPQSLGDSGVSTISAGAVIADQSAISPHALPITSTTATRSCERMVSLIFSISPITLFTAVSKPIVKSV